MDWVSAFRSIKDVPSSSARLRVTTLGHSVSLTCLAVAGRFNASELRLLVWLLFYYAHPLDAVDGRPSRL